MPATQITRAVRVEVETRLTANFNGLLATACTEFGIAAQAFTINWTPGTNYWRAPYTLQQLREIVMLDDWPCLTLASRTAVDEHDQFGGTKFKGPVQIEIGVYLVFEPRNPADMESLVEAVESALIDGLNVAPWITMVPSQGTWSMEKGDPEWVEDRWYVPVVFRADIEVTA